MKNSIIKFIKNVLYAFASNGITLLISVLMTLMLPKFLGVETYGYYQLYIFYITYATILCFGWADGVYLKLGGKAIESIDKQNYSTQFYLFAISEIILYSAIFVAVLNIVKDENKRLVLLLVSIAGFFICVRLFLNYILQATGEIKKFSISIIIEKVLFLFFSAAVILSGYRGYFLILLSDIISKAISTLVACMYNFDILKTKPTKIHKYKMEIKDNIISGSKLTVALFSSMLIVGVVKFAIQENWSIATFSKISFAFSISNMVMQFIGAVSVVLFPMLRNIEQDRLAYVYNISRAGLMILVLGGLIFYYPCALILKAWIPDYAESLRYAIVLLPICVYESKMSMIVNTYYKALRYESLLMKINFISMILSVIMTVLSVYILDNVMLSVVSILVALIFRCILGEILLSKIIGISVIKHIIAELLLSVAFILSNWYLGLMGTFVYIFAYIVYLYTLKDDIVAIKAFIKNR